MSNRNIVAFTTTTEIGKHNNSQGFYVYVADINTPWFCFKYEILIIFYYYFLFTILPNRSRVKSHKNPISVLEWDVLGKCLLIGDIAGNIEIWTPNMISDWVHTYSVHLKDEPILRVVFFHNGKKLCLPSDKKEHIQYTEKVQRSKFCPSLREFG